MKKILVVDNHLVMLKFMTNLLEKQGHKVISAENGLAALDCLETFTPEIIFSDLVMPEINGEKLCRIIRSRPEFENIFFVILSGIAIEDHLDFIGFGADICIAKGPLNKLADIVLDVLDQFDKGTHGNLQDRILGVEGLYNREVTQELISDKKHSEVILHNLAEGIIELTENKKIVFANPAAISFIGIPEEKLLASNFIKLFNDDHGERIHKLLTDLDDSPAIIPENQPVVINDKQVSLTFLPVKSKTHRLIIVILNDVDERKRLMAQLTQARKMEAIGNLAGGIAHEFNNALIGVSGNIELLKMDLSENSEIDEYIRAMLTSVHRMSRLTKQLLAYARGGKYHSEIISLSDFVENSLPLIIHKIDSSIRVETDCPSDIFSVEADETLMQMVLSAVVNNSAEAIEGRGRIRVIIRNRIIDEAFVKTRPGLYPGSYACLIIEDDGKGMDELTAKQVFEPFFTTYFQGRGLGLAAAYGIVKNHGGWISIESRLGEGTVVSIYLPKAEA